MLFKRFESGFHAFRETPKKLHCIHTDFLSALKEGFVPVGEEAQRLLYEVDKWGDATAGRPARGERALRAGRLPRERLRQMTDEALYVLAAMLPEHRRGYYSNLSRATRETIEWV